MFRLSEVKQQEHELEGKRVGKQREVGSLRHQIPSDLPVAKQENTSHKVAASAANQQIRCVHTLQKN
uniref:Uncharacterized protein n=1 Tax=Setaria digitata TaxID=48799 RepID=A0A915Q4S3_9BILA